MPKPYTVALVGAVDLHMAARIKAEIRYAAALEGALGGDEQVAAAYRAWNVLKEHGSVDNATAELAARWPPAVRVAEDAGSRDLGHFDGRGHFTVWLDRRREPA